MILQCIAQVESHRLSGLWDITNELATGAEWQALSKSYWVECSGQIRQSVSAELLLILMHILAQVLGSTHAIWYLLPLNTVLLLWDTGYHGRRNEGNFSLGKTRGVGDTFPTAWQDESGKLKSTSMQVYFKKVPLPFSERNWTSTPTRESLRTQRCEEESLAAVESLGETCLLRHKMWGLCGGIRGCAQWYLTDREFWRISPYWCGLESVWM